MYNFVPEQSGSELLHVPGCQTCGCLGFVYFTNPHTCGIKKENPQIPEIRVRKQRNNLTKHDWNCPVYLFCSDVSEASSQNLVWDQCENILDPISHFR